MAHSCPDYFEDTKGSEVMSDTVVVRGECTECGRPLSVVYDYTGTMDRKSLEWIEGGENQELTELNEVSTGEYRDIDEYVRELRRAGYNADYENLWSGISGFTAVLTVEGEEHAVFEGTPFGHLVKEVKNPVNGGDN